MNETLFEIKERIWRKWQDAKNLIEYGDANFPKLITIEISTTCNRHCPYCVNSVAPSQYYQMSQNLFELILNQLGEMRYSGKVVYSHFSEPTLDKRLPQFIRLTRELVRFAKPVVYTNGDMLTNELVYDLIEAGVSYISVTRHPPYSQQWDDKIKKLIKEWPHHIQYRGTLNDYSWLFNFGGAVKGGNRPWKICPSITWNMVIYYNGDLPLCTCVPYRIPIMGNVKDNTILEIWDKPEFVKLRKEARSGKPQLKVCKNCFKRL